MLDILLHRIPQAVLWLVRGISGLPMPTVCIIPFQVKVEYTVIRESSHQPGRSARKEGRQEGKKDIVSVMDLHQKLTVTLTVAVYRIAEF